MLETALSHEAHSDNAGPVSDHHPTDEMRAERTAHSHPAPRAGETDETGLYVGN